MKQYLILLGLAVALASCSKDDDTKPSSQGNNNNNNNGNNVPGYVEPAAVGKWLHGTFSMSNYWGYDGTYHGTPFSQSVAFNFMADGTYEMFYTGQTNYYGCTMDAFSYFKGTVVFTDSSFTTYPTQGRYRGYYACTPSSNFDRPATSNELIIKTYYYTFETDSNNKRWMLVRFNPQDQYPSYFGETSW